MIVNIDLCVPKLQSNDAKKAFEFYEKTLGFKKNWEHQYEPSLHDTPYRKKNLT